MYVRTLNVAIRKLVSFWLISCLDVRFPQISVAISQKRTIRRLMSFHLKTIRLIPITNRVLLSVLQIETVCDRCMSGTFKL